MGFVDDGKKTKFVQSYEGMRWVVGHWDKAIKTLDLSDGGCRYKNCKRQ